VGEVADTVFRIAKWAVPKRGGGRTIFFVGLFVGVFVTVSGMAVLYTYLPTPKISTSPPIIINVYPPQTANGAPTWKGEDVQVQQSEIHSPSVIENNQPKIIEIRPSQKVEDIRRQKSKNNQAQTESHRANSPKTESDGSSRCPGSSLANICAPQITEPFEPPNFIPHETPAFKDIPWLSNPKFEFRPNGVTLHFDEPTSR